MPGLTNTHVMECMPNIGSIHLTLKMTPRKATTYGEDREGKGVMEKYRITPKRLLIVKSDRSSGRVLEQREVLQFPFKVWPSKSQVLENLNGRISLKLVCEKKSKLHTKPLPSVDDSNEIATMKEHLSEIRICCRFCKQPLINDTGFERVCSLPSENWLEMVEFWVCHKGDFQQYSTRQIESKKNMLLVGTTYTLIDRENIKLSAICVSSSCKGSSVAEISCARCHATVGTGVCERQSEEGVTKDLKSCSLLKYATGFTVGKSRKNNPFRPQSVESFFAREFLGQFARGVCNRFMILTTKGIPACYVWLLNWDSSLVVSADVSANFKHGLAKYGNLGKGHNSQDETQRISVSSPSVKVLYMDLTKGKGVDDEAMKGWKNDINVEHLKFPEEACIELLLLLNASTKTLSPLNRKFQAFNTAFLHL
eukprot:Nk52_evm8s1967 gene=Nk52_evmTU8s1967